MPKPQSVANKANFTGVRDSQWEKKNGYKMLGTIPELRLEPWSLSCNMILVQKMIGWTSETVWHSTFQKKIPQLLKESW